MNILHKIMVARHFGDAPSTSVKVERIEELGPIRRVAGTYSMSFDRLFPDDTPAELDAAIVDALTDADVIEPGATVAWEA